MLHIYEIYEKKQVVLIVVVVVALINYVKIDHCVFRDLPTIFTHINNTLKYAICDG